MAREWTSTGDRHRVGGGPRPVSAPADDQGLRNALRCAFICTSELPDDLDRLLARLR